MTDTAVIILIGQEKLHIARCLKKLASLAPRQVFVVESQDDDGGHQIALDTAATLGWSTQTPKQPNNPNTVLSLVFHTWPGLYARQFNWALDNLPIEAKWVLRLDADEYLTPETIERLKEELPRMPDDVTGLTLELKRRFMGGEIRHATNGIRLLRLFRHGIGRCEERAMDEHIELSEGQAIDFDGAFYDDNLNDLAWWKAKHRGYAKREAADALAFARGEIRFKPAKEKYYRLPPYFRCLVYFCIRYFLKLGFLDGYSGWLWNFWQGLWYRLLVDREISRLLRRTH
jgi:glycosyltransferase involved in cell wall biosynthesis